MLLCVDIKIERKDYGNMAWFRKSKHKAPKEKSRGFFMSAGHGLYRNFFYVTGWLSFGFLKGNTVSLWRGIKQVLSFREKAERAETFEQAMYRLGLTEKDIAERYKNTRTQLFVYLSLSIAIFIYAIYISVVASLVTSVICFIIGSACLVKAISQHFWMYQIRQRRLGCSIKEYFYAQQKGTRQK